MGCSLTFASVRNAGRVQVVFVVTAEASVQNRCTSPMTSAALIVGIDAYTKQLTSAVRDAEDFRDALATLGLVDTSAIRLLTAPAADPADFPTRRRILDELLPFYTGEKEVDRLFVYYAGHGVLAFADAAHALPRTQLVPVDVGDLDSDGTLLIDLDSVLQRFRLAGPEQQFFFIDACRDLAYNEHPDPSTALGWKAQPAGAQRRQAIIYAVPPLGKAEGVRDGRGVMTGHLVEALQGRGMSQSLATSRSVSSRLSAASRSGSRSTRCRPSTIASRTPIQFASWPPLPTRSLRFTSTRFRPRKARTSG